MYYLLDNNTICQKGDNWLLDQIIERHENNDTKNICRKIIKQSENILDLVEVGDLIETKEKTNCRPYIIEVKEVLVGSKEKEFGKFVTAPMGSTLSVDRIQTIYKRQPNGDFKRYEVKVCTTK